MANKDKIVRYNIDNIDEKNALFNIIYGERSNGKSYQVKHKKGVIKYLETGKRFMLIRRWKDEITTEKVEGYFSDVDVFKLTNGKYNNITSFRKKLYLANFDMETGKNTLGEKIGYVVALSQEQNYAGVSYLDVEDMIFEEFMSRGEYIGKYESDKLINLWLTVDRKRGKTRLWLIGNSISRVCPYLQDWDLSEDIRTMKQGEIRVKKIDTNTTDDNGNKIFLTLAIEHCIETGKTSFAIGRHKDMLNKGSWQVDPQPHLPKSKKCYNSIYKFIFYYQSFKFLCEYLVDKETFEKCWFISPYTKDIKDNILVFSDVIKISKYWQRDIYNPNVSNDKLKKLLSTFKENMIFYATDLCGTDFKQVIDFEIRK